MNKEYIGNGIYIEMEDDALKLTTEYEELEILNTIYIEEYNLKRIIEYWAKMHGN